MPDLATHASSFAIPAVNTQLSISQVDSNNVSELRKLLSEPPEGWCWCVAWEVPTWNGWSARSAEENRSLRERLWSEGQYHAYIFRHDEEPGLVQGRPNECMAEAGGIQRLCFRLKGLSIHLLRHPAELSSPWIAA